MNLRTDLSPVVNTTCTLCAYLGPLWYRILSKMLPSRMFRHAIRPWTVVTGRISSLQEDNVFNHVCLFTGWVPHVTLCDPCAPPPTNHHRDLFKLVHLGSLLPHMDPFPTIWGPPNIYYKRAVGLKLKGFLILICFTSTIMSILLRIKNMMPLYSLALTQILQCF